MTADVGFGPFVRNLDPAERAARSRALAALVRVFVGPAAAGPLVAAVHRLERAAQAAEEALALFDALPARPRPTHSAPTPLFTQAATLPADPARCLRDGGRA